MSASKLVVVPSLPMVSVPNPPLRVIHRGDKLTMSRRLGVIGSSSASTVEMLAAFASANKEHIP